MTRGGTISGTVTDEDTGLPIAGVGINANSLGPGPGQSSLTTAEGAYTLAGLDPGSYRILPSCGTGDYIPEMYDDSLDWSRVDPVAVGVGEAVSGVDLALRKGANISGKVTDAQSGLPVGGIQVDAGPSEWKFLVATDTDGNGDYTLRGLPEGQITVIVARHGGVDYISQERTVGITGTQEVLGTDFELTLGTTISGRVTDADTGLPIANYRIELRSVLDNETSKFNTRTDSDGRYTIPGVAPGTYRIESCCDGEQYIREYYDNALIEGNADLVTIDGSEPVEGIDFTPKLGGTISGRVVDGASGLGIQGMNVTTLLPDNSQLTTTLTDSNGEYTLWGVPDGNIVVAVDGKGYVEQRQTVTVQDGEDLTGVDF
jgi:5-hydroxyisourate hydrolase-like protein (transthyretin family)